MSSEALSVEAFIERWQSVQLTDATELASSQTFILDLCNLLGVSTPLPSVEQDYMFERPITFMHGDGSSSAGRIDCYRRGAFVWESKKLRHVKPSSTQFDAAMLTARAQAENYARALPPQELAQGRPPFLLVCDIGNVIEVYAEFTRSGATYTPFPDPRSHRIALADLVKPEIRERLKQIWTDPESLNPARLSARVTREVAAQLADLAKFMEASGHRADHVAAYLTRCLFSMFAEDVELLPKGSFLKLLQQHRQQPSTLQLMLRTLWADMDQGGFSAALAHPVLHFNGKLFKEPMADGYSLLLDAKQIDQLIIAAQANWREVEPAIFGTLLERALDASERHALGAHYTPRAYVERLVLPTVMEPLRADWANVQAAAVLLAQEAAELSGKAQTAKIEEACAEVRKFHHQLCTTRVLDPACGSGNFLYVTLEHLKRLEGEVLNQLEAFGQSQDSLALEGETVTLQQLRGIEINERAAALAELVLWIGYLQWHIRTRGNKAVAEPVVHNYGNIECRDAVLAWDDLEPAYDASGQLLTRWDGKTTKTHPITGAQVPDEAAQVPQWRYLKPRKATWPQADFVIGNPPFIGAATMRAALGDGYVQTLRQVWKDVPESADFVMYWWAHAASLLAKGKLRRSGLITTNSLRQTFNRRVVQAALDQKLGLSFAIPDHPWVDNANGAAVRIAMTVLMRQSDFSLDHIANIDVLSDIDTPNGRLLTVTHENRTEDQQDCEMLVTLAQRYGLIHADLSVGANVATACALQSNENLSNRGVQLFGAGFILTPEQAVELGYGSQPDLNRIIRQYRNGRDLTETPRLAMVIDAFGLTSEQLRSQFPTVYQWLHDRVKPERDLNNRASYRDNWWIHGEPRKVLRKQLANLPRYIATVETAKHRIFQFLDAAILPDNKLIAIALADAFSLGVLSSRLHGAWALAAGSTLEDRPVYVKTTCFETFPFPSEETGLTPALRETIGGLAEQIDAHRKRQQAAHPELTLTGIYNVLQALRAGQPLTDKEKRIHSQGLVAVLLELHQELDAAVLQAYGWADLANADTTDALLERLVALNAQRAAEEKSGLIRWLRPEFQNPAFFQSAQMHSDSLSKDERSTHMPKGLQANLALEAPSSQPAQAAKRLRKTSDTSAALQAQLPRELIAWPAHLPEQVRAVAALLQENAAGLRLQAIEASFKGRGPWKKSLPRILETLQALGRAKPEGELWRI
jgi:hypothetical protein